MIFAATGRPAFGGDSVEAVIYRIMTEQPDISGVPPSLLPVVTACLNKDPQARPSARDVLLRLVDPSQRPWSPPPGQTAPAVPVPATGPLWDDVPVRTGSVPELAGSPGITRARSRRGPVLAASGAAAVIALIAVGVLLLTRGSPPATPNGIGTSSAAAAVSTSPTVQASTSAATTTRAAGVTIPAAFAGTWSGTATMEAIGVPSLGLQNSISFTLAKGGTTAAEVNGSCVNTLTLAKVTSSVLTFNEPATDLCVAGTVTFTLKDGNLAYLWSNGVEQNAATLRKK